MTSTNTRAASRAKTSVARSADGAKPSSRTRATGARTPGRTSDAIVLLKADHRAVETLFRSFERSGDSAHKTRRRLVDEMIANLSAHAFVEEQVLYPAAKREVPSAHDLVMEAVEEHHVVKWQLQELVGLDPRDERFAAKVTVLIEGVRHHVDEEEAEFFPKVRAALGRKRLVELGGELEEVRRDAPRLPHPRLPDGPVDHLVPEVVTHVIDRAKDVVASVRSGS